MYFKIFLLFFYFSLSGFSQKLPSGLKWETNEKSADFSDANAQKGGTFRLSMISFPLTLRTVGPDSNGVFASVMRSMQMGLTSFHPETEEIIPQLAKEWAYGADGKTVYYKIRENAQWSDGKPITSDDFIFTLEFMRSKYILAPWYNRHYTEEIKEVVAYDSKTLSISGTKIRPQKDLHYYYGMSPTPKHFYNLDSNFIKNYNWKIPPSSSAYSISEVKKGNSVTLSRVKGWWGENLKYYKNRYNADKIVYTVVRDPKISFEYFKKNQLDAFVFTNPSDWYDKTTDKNFLNGYIGKLWFWYDSPQPKRGLWINTQSGLLKNISIRLGLAYSLNFKYLIDKVLRGDALRLMSDTDGYNLYTNGEIKPREFDLMLAKENFEKAGFKSRDASGILTNGSQKLSFSILYGTPDATDKLVVLKEEAKKAGVELKLQLMDTSQAFKSISDKKFELAWIGLSASWRPQYWEIYHSDNANKTDTNNFSNLVDQELDSLIKKYDSESNEKEKIRLAHLIQKKSFDLASFIPGYKTPYFREAFWRYWQLPKNVATKLSESAFDPVGEYGGLFWFYENEFQKTKKAQSDNKKLPQIYIQNSRYKK